MRKVSYKFNIGDWVILTSNRDNFYGKISDRYSGIYSVHLDGWDKPITAIVEETLKLDTIRMMREGKK